jgi:hypothetical protein
MGKSKGVFYFAFHIMVKISGKYSYQWAFVEFIKK